jgi:hypothetical protein
LNENGRAKGRGKIEENIKEKKIKIKIKERR